MSNYVYGQQQIIFSDRDVLAPGQPEKAIKGSQMDAEFNRLTTVSAEKLDTNGSVVDGGTF